MDTFKGLLARLRRQKNKNKRLIIGFAIMSPFFLVAILAVFCLPDWRAISAWEKLRHQASEDICRDDCQLKRQNLRKDALSRYERLLPEMIDCVFSKGCSLPAKREALALMLEKDAAACQSLLAPVRSRQAEIDFETFIILYGDCGLALAPADLRLASFFLQKSDSEAKAEMLRMLARAVPGVALEACKQEILVGGLESEAVSILAWLAGKEAYLPQDDFRAIAERSLERGDENLARRLVWLAGDYYDRYPDIVRDILLGAVSGPYDAPTRAIAASVLEERGVAVAVIELREEDLDE